MTQTTASGAPATALPDLDPRDESGLEPEREDHITHPFAPEQVRIRTEPFLVLQIVSRIEHKEIDLAPDFQRLRGIWDRGRKSRLIESLLLRIPLPVFYVSADDADNWAVVDGVQRMSTICDYVTDRFALTGLQYLSQCDGLMHSELSRSMQRRISETKLGINIIEPKTPPEVMYNIFLRINTGGMPLNGQEIRHALNPGPVRDYLRRLSESNEFLEATGHTVRPHRMADRECVLRFLAFHISPWSDYSSNDLNGYLGRAMKMINHLDGLELERYAADFKTSMRTAISIFGRYAFRKRAENDNRIRPVNKALFESWSVELASRSDEELALLVDRRDDVERRFMALIDEDEEFNRSITYATASTQRVHKRFSAIHQIVEECILAS